jgi:hypothetical protein
MSIPSQNIGKRVEVFWESEDSWFQGIVDQYDASTGYKVIYDDGDVEWLKVLDSDIVRIISDIPSFSDAENSPSPKNGSAFNGLCSGDLSIMIDEISCVDLKGVETLGNNDPYVLLSLGSWEYKTHAIENAGSSAVWRKLGISLPVDNPNNSIVVQVIDRNRLISDKIIGKAEFSIATLLSSSRVVLTLRDENNDESGTATFTTLNRDIPMERSEAEVSNGSGKTSPKPFPLFESPFSNASNSQASASNPNNIKFKGSLISSTPASGNRSLMPAKSNDNLLFFDPNRGSFSNLSAIIQSNLNESNSKFKNAVAAASSMQEHYLHIEENYIQQIGELNDIIQSYKSRETDFIAQKHYVEEVTGRMSKMEALSSQLKADFDKQYKELSRKNSKLESVIESKTTELAEVKQIVIDLRSQIEQRDDDRRSTVLLLEADLKLKREEIDSLKQKVGDLHQELQVKDDSIAKLSKLLDKKSKEIDQLQAKYLSDIENEKNKLRSDFELIIADNIKQTKLKESSFAETEKLLRNKLAESEALSKQKINSFQRELYEVKEINAQLKLSLEVYIHI